MHGPPDRETSAARRSREGQKVTLVGALVSLGLSIVQITAGIAGRSQAMVADGIHSVSDLITDIAVWVGLRFSAAPPDADHPWGHGKIETLVSVFVGAALVFVGFGIGSEAMIRLREGVAEPPTALPLLAAALCIVSKEIVYRWTARVGRRIHSQAIIANAWHHRTDALSSIAAFIGIAGAMAGFKWMDPMAAAVVSLFIVKVGGQVIWQGLKDLTERQVDPEIVARLHDVLMADPDVTDAHRIRLRNLGGFIVGDVHVCIDGGITVREGHDIVDRLEEKVRAEVPGLEDLVVHVEPDHLDFSEKDEKR